MIKRSYTIILLFITIISFVFLSNETYANNSIKTINTDHVFTVKLSQPVTLEEAKKHIYFKCLCDEKVHYDMYLANNGKNIKIVPLRGLQPLTSYEVHVSQQLTSNSNKQLQAGLTATFKVNPLIKQAPELSGPIADFVKEFDVIETANANFYSKTNYSNEALQILLNHYNQELLPFLETYYPRVAKSTIKPNIILLWTEQDTYNYIDTWENHLINFNSVNFNPSNAIVLGVNELKYPIYFNSTYYEWALKSVYESRTPEPIQEATIYIHENIGTNETTKFIDTHAGISSLRSFYEEQNVEQLLQTFNSETILSLAFLYEEWDKPTVNDYFVRTSYLQHEQAFQETFNITEQQLTGYYDKVNDYLKEHNLKSYLNQLAPIRFEYVTLYSENEDNFFKNRQLIFELQTYYFERLKKAFPFLANNTRLPDILMIESEEQIKRLEKYNTPVLGLESILYDPVFNVFYFSERKNPELYMDNLISWVDNQYYDMRIPFDIQMALSKILSLQVQYNQDFVLNTPEMQLYYQKLHPSQQSLSPIAVNLGLAMLIEERGYDELLTFFEKLTTVDFKTAILHYEDIWLEVYGFPYKDLIQYAHKAKQRYGTP